jgi:3-methylfumaryl-CoA hydratase
MWAGSQFEFNRPPRVGDRITRVSTIADVAEKSGRTGPLAFVKVRHEIRANDEPSPAIVEFHDIVYREAAKPGDEAPPPKAAPSQAHWQRRWVPDDVLLFRFSALTFNGHRIHYDRKYVTEVEGYPGLIVHGPLIATLLLDLLRSELPDAVVRRYEFRAVRPLFDINPFDVCGEPSADGKSVRLWARDHEGWLAMDATAQVGLWSTCDETAYRYHCCHTRTRHRGAVRDAAACRPGRARHQGRAPRRRRLRARLRRARARAGLALRVDEPQQGKPDARREASRGAGDPAPSDSRTS